MAHEENTLLVYLTADAAASMRRWERLEEWMRVRFDREPSIEALLFLIGVQSRGRGFEPDLAKDLKQSLIMEGTYCAFETLGAYKRVGMEHDGHWIWERILPVPAGLSIDDQEKLLRTAILRYFSDILDEPEDHEV